MGMIDTKGKRCCTSMANIWLTDQQRCFNDELFAKVFVAYFLSYNTT